MELLNQSGKYKILIMGLDNSGKTSILVSMSKEGNILSYCALKPTKGINIRNYEIDDCKLNIWDFGGQRKFRDDYLNNFSKYLSETDKIIYVFDVQDLKRYNLALDYFNDIINLIRISNLNIELNIFLHKFDPNIREKEEFKDIDEIVDEKLVDRIEQILPKEIRYKIFKTTIYSVFEKDMIKTNE